MIFAAGLGTRLRPLTDDRPKALVTAGGRTLLEIVLERLAASGFEHVVVNVHHFGEQIIEWLTTHPTPMPVVVSDERQMLLDTGGGLRAARRLFADAPVLIHNVDIMSDAPLTKLYDEACSSGHTTLLTSDRSTSRYLLADEHSRLVGWTNIQRHYAAVPSPAYMSSPQNCWQRWRDGLSASPSSTSTCGCVPVTQ